MPKKPYFITFFVPFPVLSHSVVFRLMLSKYTHFLGLWAYIWVRKWVRKNMINKGFVGILWGMNWGKTEVSYRDNKKREPVLYRLPLISGSDIDCQKFVALQFFIAMCIQS